MPSLARYLPFIRFLIVGGLSLATDLGALWLFRDGLHLWLWLSLTFAYGLAFIVNFGLGRMWVFRSTGAVGRQLPPYIALVAGNLLVTDLAVPAINAAGVNYLLAKLAVAAVLAVANFFVSRRWIFVADQREAAEIATPV